MPYPQTTADSFGKLIDLTNQESHVFNWNPTEIKEAVEASFSRQTIPGLSHKRTQFLNTNNREIEFSLMVDGLVHGGPKKVEEARRFLLSTMYPRSSIKIQGAGAPKMLLIIPGSFRVKGYVSSVSFNHTIFYSDMKIRRFEASIKFVEEPDKRITSQDVRSVRLAISEEDNFLDFRNF